MGWGVSPPLNLMAHLISANVWHSKQIFRANFVLQICDSDLYRAAFKVTGPSLQFPAVKCLNFQDKGWIQRNWLTITVADLGACWINLGATSQATRRSTNSSFWFQISSCGVRVFHLGGGGQKVWYIPRNPTFWWGFPDSCWNISRGCPKSSRKRSSCSILAPNFVAGGTYNSVVERFLVVQERTKALSRGHMSSHPNPNPFHKHGFAK